MQSAEKQVDGHLEKIDNSIVADDESSSLVAALLSSVPSSSSLPTSSMPLSSPKKRKRPTMDGGGLASTSTETSREADLWSRKEILHPLLHSNTMTDNHRTLFCVVEGETPSNAFPVEIELTKTIGDLKDLIKTKKTNNFHD
ncbi:hypothetical protein BG006_011289, partial [Podila minutissima]